MNHKGACGYFYVFTTRTAAATTGPAGTYFTTTFTNDLENKEDRNEQTD